MKMDRVLLRLERIRDDHYRFHNRFHTFSYHPNCPKCNYGPSFIFGESEEEKQNKEKRRKMIKKQLRELVRINPL